MARSCRAYGLSLARFKTNSNCRPSRLLKLLVLFVMAEEWESSWVVCNEVAGDIKESAEMEKNLVGD